MQFYFFAIVLVCFFGCSSSQNCIPSINWANCPTQRRCDACFSVSFNNQRDIMCLQNKGTCIFTGNLIGDGSFAVVTGSNGCAPFSNDPLEVSLASPKCSGGFLVQNGQTKLPPPAFGPGVTDIVLPVPSSSFSGGRNPTSSRINFA